MRAGTLAHLSVLLLAAAPFATAAPHDHPAYPYDARSHAPNRTPPTWRRLSDAIIRKIWSLPSTQRNSEQGAITTHQAATEQFVARYGEDVVLRFTIRSAEEAKALAEAADVLFLDVWEFNEDWADIRVAKNVVPSLLGLLPSTLKQSHQPLMQDLDLAQAIFDSYPSSSATQSHQDDHSYAPDLKTSQRKAKGHPFLQDYQPMSVINPWMKLMASMFTTHVRRITVGTTYEGRDIPALRVGVHPTNNDEPSGPRKTVLITGGSHAREWISTSTVNYVAWNLINSYGKDREMTRLLEEFDFVLVPTLNPDGYIYSWESDRLQPTNLRFCDGVDLDRSYSYKWDGDTVRTNPCSESYAGSEAFEAVEAARFAQWARNETDNNNVQFVGFLDLHSYSQQILYPYSYSCADEPPALEDLEELAIGLAKAIRVSRKGHAYKVSSACEGNVMLSTSSSTSKKDRTVLPRIESSGGSALDWFYHELKVKYSYQIKLRDTGSYGFLLPKENIAPTGEEMLDAVLYFGRFMLGEVGLGAAEKNGKTQAKLTKPDEEGWEFVNKEDVEGEVIEL
ncbi:putative metallocarboxypeptidase ecm14 [Curvularia kusanoi]|uniref:Inactive metallocarboxypeptidase ECM14 n=1 Tax=Curvularia kusanoi TaxID=90978 RepID=A0A9P4T5I4_CURKU|nr:putative metallocarboxypeptidase ecm14 [Curvularia kusanoi]